MDMFDFEELVADMLDITEEQREDDSYLMEAFEEKFEMDFDTGYEFAKALLPHTLVIEAGLTGTRYHAFVNKEANCMMMKTPAKD